MLFQTLLFYLLLLSFLLPLIIAGIIILRKFFNLERFELLFPVGSIFGVLIYIFIINTTSFFIKGSTGAILSYLILISLSIAVYFKKGLSTVIFPNGKLLLLYIASLVFWGALLIWKGNYALIGSDTNLYYAVAHTFIRGNFPPMTPWQPDIPLSYHIGASELLGAFHFFTGLSFQFLHLFFSIFSIFCSAQIIIWLVNRTPNLTSFLLANLAVAVTFISFGFFYITWPVLPPHLPTFASFNQAILWLRELPTVNQAIEVYGAPVNLDGLIYFIFHALGLAIFLSLLVLLLYIKKAKSLFGWLIICLGLASLALVNEALLIAAFPSITAGIFLMEIRFGTLSKNLKKILILLTVIVLIIFYQGGIISASVSSYKSIDSSAVIFPKKEDVRDDFASYHLGQESSKLLSEKEQWLPLRWFHPGSDLLILVSFLVILLVKNELRQTVLLKILFIAAVASLTAYNVIVPKFLVANGNRFLSTSFLLFALLLSFFLIIVWEKIRKKLIRKNLIKRVLFFTFVGWILIPTLLPPLALLSKTRFGENKLEPRVLESSQGILWLKKNTNFYERVMVLDKNAPHPSGQSRALVEAGVFAPVWVGNFRAFTIEASPQYMDIAYFLSPEALSKFKISLLLLDSTFYNTLPPLRKLQLNNAQFFDQIFNHSNNESEWERIYKVREDYLKTGGEIEGTFKELDVIVPKMGKVYIDIEENFEPSFLRRPLIFTLKNRELYFNPGSGVYLNVEVNIPFQHPDKNKHYDYLVLSEKTDPELVCNCHPKLIWEGIRRKVKIWRSNN